MGRAMKLARVKWEMSAKTNEAPTEAGEVNNPTVGGVSWTLTNSVCSLAYEMTKTPR